VELIEVLMKYGDNIMVVDYYFAILVTLQQFSIYRGNFNESVAIEELFQHYLEMTKSNAEVAIMWMQKIKRLIA
jgi:hypothetical protein